MKNNGKDKTHYRECAFKTKEIVKISGLSDRFGKAILLAGAGAETWHHVQYEDECFERLHRDCGAYSFDVANNRVGLSSFNRSSVS
jgi:hypothetical protein